MKIIKELEEFIADELSGAYDYAKMAVKYKTENPDMARMFYEMANAELSHKDNLHKMIVSKIEEYKKQHGTPPVAMQAVYDWEHEKQIAETAEIKAMLDSANN